MTMKIEKNHKDIFVYGNKAITLEGIVEAGVMKDGTSGFVVYGDGRHTNLSTKMAKALLVELCQVTVTEVDT
jgi:hypothetical protein